MIYLLLGLLIILFLIAFYSAGEDILAPGSIVCLMWMFSTVCAIYNIEKWGIALHSNTIEVIVLGLTSFIVGAFLGKRIPALTIGKRKKISGAVDDLLVIDVWKLAFCFLLAINIVTVLWQIKWVLSQVGSIGVWSEMMTAYRSENSSWNTEAISKPSILSNLEILLAVTAYITTYIGINNIFAGEKKRKIIYLFVPGILFATDKILNAGRGDILLYIGAIVLIVYIELQTKYQWKKKVSRKYIKYMVVAVIAVTLLFSASRSWVGRTNESDTLDYVTMYAGGPIQLFDMFMQNPENPSEIFGKETFHTLINYLGRVFKISNWRYISHLEFRYSNGVNLGNVYGAFRYYLYDFGYIGVIFLPFAAAVFYAYIYQRIRKGKCGAADGFKWGNVFYMYIAPSLFMYSIADYTYALLFNFVAIIKWFVFAWIIKRLLVNRNFPIRMRR